MMKAQDSDGSVHYICQRLSCQYEEREVKVRISTGESGSSKKMTTTADGKIRVVIAKKSSVKLPKAIYETKTEVVRESKKVFKEHRNNDSKRFSEPRRGGSAFSSSNDFLGGTMADFFRMSQERDAERKNRKKK